MTESSRPRHAFAPADHLAGKQLRGISDSTSDRRRRYSIHPNHSCGMSVVDWIDPEIMVCLPEPGRALQGPSGGPAPGGRPGVLPSGEVRPCRVGAADAWHRCRRGPRHGTETRMGRDPQGLGRAAVFGRAVGPDRGHPGREAPICLVRHRVVASCSAGKTISSLAASATRKKRPRRRARDRGLCSWRPLTQRRWGELFEWHNDDWRARLLLPWCDSRRDWQIPIRSSSWTLPPSGTIPWIYWEFRNAVCHLFGHTAHPGTQTSIRSQRTAVQCLCL
jgi:hypothetical protein